MSATTTAPSWAADIDDVAWEAALTVLRATGTAGRTIALACHADPDGDALGSLLALHHALRSLGYATVASWGSQPFAIPPQYTFLPGLDTLTPPSAFPLAADLLVTLDAGSPERLGSLSRALSRARRVLVIDHHASNDAFGDVNLVAPHAAASVVVVEELLRRLGATIDRDVAACLYTGLVTDTGRFQYRNTDPEVMELASRLLAHDIRHSEISRQMFETHSFGYLKTLAAVLDRARFDHEVSLIHSYVTQQDLTRWGVAFEETEGLIDVLRTADSAEVVMILKQAQDGTWRVSLRSKGRVDVGALASDLGGGGHAYSAGFTGTADPDELVGAVRERLL
ncbi:MAG TPA: bifunctional oligoribonuclease/PAP phosphatase NrnA [Nitriliruptorales bacterium]